METEQEESPLSKEERRAIRSRLLDRGIFKLYEIGVKWMPIPLMLGHWYGVWDYSRYSRPIILDTDTNGNCVIWLYILAYVYMPLAMLPASYFYKYCWMFRIPFIYFFGINAIRIYYKSWMIRPEQIEAHHIFIIFTIILYIYGFIKLTFERGTKCA